MRWRTKPVYYLLLLLPSFVLLAESGWILNSLDDLQGPFALRCYAMDGQRAMFVPPWSAATLFAVAGGTVVTITIESLRNPPQGAGAFSVFFGGLVITMIFELL